MKIFPASPPYLREDSQLRHVICKKIPSFSSRCEKIPSFGGSSVKRFLASTARFRKDSHLRKLDYEDIPSFGNSFKKRFPDSDAHL